MKDNYDGMDVDLLWSAHLDDFEEVAYEDFIIVNGTDSELNRVTDAAGQGRGNKFLNRRI